MTDNMTPLSEQVAAQFHEAYERLAPSFGYETRHETRAFNPASPNGRLMIAVCAEVMDATLKAHEAVVAAGLVFSRYVVDVADGMTCTDPSEDCERCKLYGARRTFIAALSHAEQLVAKKGE
jgi:hypothetical protein